MKKLKKIVRLLRLVEEERYNIKELAERIYGSSDELHRCHIRGSLTYLRKKGIPVYPQGINGIVKIPSNVEEWRLTNQRDYNRKRGSLMMYMRLVRYTLLEEPKLRKEILPQLDNLKIIASMGQVKKLYGNKTKKLKSGQNSTKDGDKTDRHQSVKTRSKAAKTRDK